MQRKKQALIIFALVLVVGSLLTAAAVIQPASMQIAHGADLAWEQTFGGAGDDRAFYAANVAGNFVVVGSSTSFEEGKTVACIVLFDGAGNQLWNRTFTEGLGAEFRYIAPVDEGFWVVGNIFYPAGGVSGLVMKLDAQGNPVWNTTLNAGAAVNKLFSAAVDGADLVAVGLTQPSSNANVSQAWIVKIDQNGTPLWTTTTNESTECAARAIAVTQDHTYMAAGYINTDGDDNYDFFALKLDPQGKLLWTKTYGGAQSDKAYTLTTSGASCVMAGDTRSKGAGDCDVWAVKIDLNGNLLWDQTVGGKDFDSPTYITVSQNGGYIVAGTTFSFGNGFRDFWLLKLGEDGKVLWTCTVGRSNYEEAYAAVYDGDGGYVVAGWTNSIGAGGRYDFYVVDLKVGVSKC
jgi:hypothetical protein